MTASEFQRLTNGTGSAQAHGWLVSLLCHMLGAGCALLLLAEIEKPVLPNTFQWEVALVEIPAPVEPAPLEKPFTKPVVQPPRPLVSPILPAQQTVHEVVPRVETVRTVQQTTQEVVPQAEAVMERPAIQSIESQAVPTSQEAVVAHVSTEAAVTSSVERTEPVQERTATVEHAVPPVESLPSAIEHRVVQHRLVKVRQTQADYGWLRDALWSRIEALKRYPAQAKANHWEGKVVVDVVIRDDGTVVDLQVAESSGRAILDQEALAVMKQASPLVLKHPLGRPSVRLLVPISYKLDG